MIELLQFTNDPTLAQHCDRLAAKFGPMRLVIDWERNGKAERQAGRNTFISTHTEEDLHALTALRLRTPVMVRVNPLHAGSAAEVDAAVAGGANRLMLPMFRSAADVEGFVELVAGRLPISLLLEHADAANSIDQWVNGPGFDEVYVGLNDLHLSLGHSFMFEPLANGLVEGLVNRAKAAGKRVGFGGIARMDEGELPGSLVLAEHVRLGSQAVILSRTFHRFDVAGDSMESLDAEVGKLRACEVQCAKRSASEVLADQQQVQAIVANFVQRKKALL